MLSYRHDGEKRGCTMYIASFRTTFPDGQVEDVEKEFISWTEANDFLNGAMKAQFDYGDGFENSDFRIEALE